MKFLLWQFSLYAMVALGVGALLSWLWSRSTTGALRRGLARAQRQVTEEREAARKLRRERDEERVLVVEATELVGKLTELRAAFSVIDADLHASTIARTEAERSRDAMGVQLAELRRTSHPSDRWELERLRSEREAEFAQHNVARTEILAELAAQRAELDASLKHAAALAHRHDELVVASQELISIQTLRAEDAEAEARLLRARIEVLEALIDRSDRGVEPMSTVPAVPVVIDLRDDAPVLDLTGGTPNGVPASEGRWVATTLPPVSFPSAEVEGLPVS